MFTTVQKFASAAPGEPCPVLTNRRNVVVIADVAHQSQYDFIDGFARHLRDALPNANFIGFTGTLIEADDRSTTAVFGEYITGDGMAAVWKTLRKDGHSSFKELVITEPTTRGYPV